MGQASNKTNIEVTNTGLRFLSLGIGYLVFMYMYLVLDHFIKLAAASAVK